MACLWVFTNHAQHILFSQYKILCQSVHLGCGAYPATVDYLVPHVDIGYNRASGYNRTAQWLTLSHVRDDDTVEGEVPRLKRLDEDEVPQRLHTPIISSLCRFVNV